MTPDPFRLDGKTALVTGCSRGIGAGVARGLAQAGADIIGIALEDSCETEVDIRAAGRSFRSFTCDFSDRKSLYDVIGRVNAECPPIDILFNNAGIILRKPAEEHPDEYWDKVIEINLNAQFIMAREIGRGMLERGSGRIVFTASLLSFQGGILVPSYAASKGGVAQLMMALSNEWVGRGVNVNAIAPGYIATENTAALRADEERSKALMNRIPAGRYGTPDDLAGAVVFLCSPAASYVNGHILVVDGGWMAR